MHDSPDSPRPPRPRTGWIAATLIVLAVIAVGALLWSYHKLAPRPAAAPAPVAQPAASAPPPAEASVPVLDSARVRALLESISSNANFRAWLAHGDFVRRWVVVTDNLAEGVSPRKQLGFLAVTRPFSVAGRGKGRVIAPESYSRYDEFADVVASVDAKSFAAAYRELHPALEAAYRELGYPNASFDNATSRALRRIEGVPVPEGEVRVEGNRGGPYAFADPRLERLAPVEKQILRMGPKNAGRIQAKAREIREALGLAAEGASPKQ